MSDKAEWCLHDKILHHEYVMNFHSNIFLNVLDITQKSDANKGLS